MQIVPISYLPSQEVLSFAQIKEEAKEMEQYMIEHGGQTMVALHNMQVRATDFKNFFVVNKKLLPLQVITDLESLTIINPRILSYGPKQTMYEGCASFPHKSKKGKAVDRSVIIKAEYQIPDGSGLKKITKELTGVAAQIFQHETDHGLGKNIYYENQKTNIVD